MARMLSGRVRFRTVATVRTVTYRPTPHEFDDRARRIRLVAARDPVQRAGGSVARADLAL